jgi:hypothetical protein
LTTIIDAIRREYCVSLGEKGVARIVPLMGQEDYMLLAGPVFRYTGKVGFNTSFL